MKDENSPITNARYQELARLCGVLSNPARISLLKKFACEGSCVKDDFIDIDGLAKFTEGINLKYRLCSIFRNHVRWSDLRSIQNPIR